MQVPFGLRSPFNGAGAEQKQGGAKHKCNVLSHKALKFDSKLADCYSKDRKKCEIYITEGDSASGNLKMARNNEFQAVLPVRGKILNTQKAPLEKIQKNAEIMTMIEAFGLTIDFKNMKGERGEKGPIGTIYTPSVSNTGILSWENDGGLPNPQSRNIADAVKEAIGGFTFQKLTSAPSAGTSDSIITLVVES